MNPWIRRAAMALAPIALRKGRQLWSQRQGGSGWRAPGRTGGRPVSSGRRRG